MSELISLRIALIGAGRMGRSHVIAAQELGFRLVAICDKNDENMKALGEEFGVSECNHYVTSEELFNSQKDIDLVVIATTANAHCELVVQSANAGVKYIMCEKPMATSLADCDTMIDACKKSGTRLAINHQMRFMDQYISVAKELETEKFGPISSMSVYGGSFGISMNGSHYFEAFKYLTGSRINTVTAWFSSERLNNPRGPEFFDQAGQIRAEGDKGQRFTLDCGADQGHGMAVMYGARYGHIFVDEFEAVYYATARKPEHIEQPMTRYGMPWDRWENHFTPADNVAPTKAVINALVNGEDYPSGEDGKYVTAVLVAAHKSADSGNVAISIDDLQDYYEQRFPWA